MFKIFLVLFFVVFNNRANSIELGHNLSGNLNVKIGTGVQFYHGVARSLVGKSGFKQAYPINTSIGTDLYFKLNKFDNIINPFIGLEFGGNYNFKNEFFKDYNLSRYLNITARFNRYLNINTRFGGHFRVNGKFSIKTYAILGFNVSRYRSSSILNNITDYSNGQLYKGLFGASIQRLQDNGYLDTNKIYEETKDVEQYNTPYGSEYYRVYMSNALREELTNNMSEETFTYAKERFGVTPLKSGAMYYFFPTLFNLYTNGTSGDLIYYGTRGQDNNVRIDDENFTSIDNIRLGVMVGWQANDSENGRYIPLNEIDLSRQEYYENNGKFVFDVLNDDKNAVSSDKNFINSDEIWDDGGRFVLLNDGHLFHKIDKNFIFYKDNDPDKWYYVMVRNVSEEQANAVVEEWKNSIQNDDNEDAKSLIVNLDDVKQWLREHNYEPQTHKYDKFQIGLNVGLGIEGVYNFNHHFAGIFGVEYIYSQVIFGAMKIQTHTIGLKLGAQIG